MTMLKVEDDCTCEINSMHVWQDCMFPAKWLYYENLDNVAAKGLVCAKEWAIHRIDFLPNKSNIASVEGCRE